MDGLMNLILTEYRGQAAREALYHFCDSIFARRIR